MSAPQCSGDELRLGAKRDVSFVHRAKLKSCRVQFDHARNLGRLAEDDFRIGAIFGRFDDIERFFTMRRKKGHGDRPRKISFIGRYDLTG